MMLAEPFLTSHLRTLSVLVVHLLLTDICRGQLIGASQPIVATLGDDIILPCHLEPAEDVTEMTLEWSRPDLIPRFVYVWRSGLELEGKKHKTFQGRTTLFTEELQHGNISLRLNRVKLSDKGTYSCYIPTLEKQTNVQLVVGAASPPVISLAGINGHTGGVVLQCESAGWYPEPEVLWLDAEGNLLSAGPTETVRGPDDLYTVSSRVTVEKKHGNKFTCRVQQNNINQTRDTWIHVPDDFFIIPYSSAVPIIVGLSVSLVVCIMLILASGFFLWRKNRTKTKRTLDKTEKEEKNCCETEAEMLMSHEVVEMQDLGEKDPINQHMVHDGIQMDQEAVEEEMTYDEDQMRKEAVEEEKTPTEENNQLTGNQAAGSQTIWDLLSAVNPFKGNQAEQQKKEEAEDEVASLKKKLKDAQEEANRRWKEVNDIQRESRTKLLEKDAEISKLRRQLDKKIWEEKQKNGKDLKELDGSKSEDVDHQIESRQQSSRSSDHHSDLRDIILDEVHHQGKYLRLKNTSTEEKLLGGCKLELHINNRELCTYTFDQSFKVKAGGEITLWCADYGHHDPAISNLVWKDLKPLKRGDLLQFILFNQTGEFKGVNFHTEQISSATGKEDDRLHPEQ
ncbi:butyrophilin-like protein 1 isoform X2 [Amphiprion ocellaris]|uniref:butyrophilin-like protein 1 isoform X2 n=1 Tax=Amphiprion ocellaris TaxID=80972 RepID=UPI002410C28B|nr:butyrophilin-like protein 1 isoform X2 [Amphiprion ocellaris]